MSAPKLPKPKAQTPTDNLVTRSKDTYFETTFPNLYARMTDTTWEDGSFRRTDTLTIFLQDGMLKGVLKDRNQDKSAFLSSNTLKDLLEALEAALLDDSLHWKQNKPWTPQ